VQTDAALPTRYVARAPTFSVFAWLWAAGILFHMSSYSEPVEPVTVAMFLSALAVIFGLFRTSAFFALVAAHVLYVYMRLPRVPNHSVLAAAINITILAAAAWLAVQKRGWKIDLTALYKSFAPVVRIELLVLYFFVVFHKLNSGFFNAEHSCGSFMYLRLAREYPFLPTGNWVRWSIIFLTILIEATIPIMLAVRRFRLAGLWMAFIFHFALAMDPGDVVFNFSAILIALFVLFLPEESAPVIVETVTAGRDRVLSALRAPRAVAKAGAFAVVAPLAAVLIFRDGIPTGLTFEASRAMWVVYAAAILGLFVATLRTARLDWPSARALVTAGTPGLLIIPAVLVVNGLLPYLGLKTETSFAMYSNLHTEGGRTNHWLMSPKLQVWDFQRDLVRIRRTSVNPIQRLANRGYSWPYYEFKWMMQAHPDASVTYEHNGKVHRVRRVADAPEFAPGNPLLRKFMRFRPVARDDRTLCIH
jgi:hypothetical protein